MYITLYFNLLIGIAVISEDTFASDLNNGSSDMSFNVNYTQKTIDAYDRRLPAGEIEILSERAASGLDFMVSRLAALGVTGEFWFAIKGNNIKLLYNGGRKELSVPELSADFIGGLLSIVQVNNLTELTKYFTYLLENDVYAGGNKIADHPFTKTSCRQKPVDYNYENYNDTF